MKILAEFQRYLSENIDTEGLIQAGLVLLALLTAMRFLDARRPVPRDASAMQLDVRSSCTGP